MTKASYARGSGTRARGATDIERAAQRQLYSVLPSAKSGTLEFDVWQSIHAPEDALSDERGKTTRLSRTRQKITRDGEAKTVSDLVTGKASEGFRMLIERDMPELTFEALAIKHSDELGADVAEAGRLRLREAGIDAEAP